MNNITFVEAARHLAERVLKPEGLSPSQRISRAFRIATSRVPRPDELKLLLADLAQYKEDFEGNPNAAKRLRAVGEKPGNPKLDPAEVAAYTLISNTVLNLDEAITQN